MIALLIIAPTLIAFVLMGASVLFDKPISLEKVGWLLTYAQISSIALGCTAILFSKKSVKAMPLWRIKANEWIGNIMAVSGLFYLVVFFFVAYFGP